MEARYEQKTMPFFNSSAEAQAERGAITSSDNTVSVEDQAFHNWYRFVLSYPPHLVRDYLRDFELGPNATVLDPFCGTGTTVLESKLNQIGAVGLEANPFPRFASSVKVNWDVDPTQLSGLAEQVAETTYTLLADQGIDDRFLRSDPAVKLRTLDAKAQRALIKNSISPLPLHKVLVLREQLDKYKESPAHKYGLLALGNALVTSIGNLRFGPEVGVGKIKQDTPVIAAWLVEIEKMVHDLELVRGQSFPKACVHLADARDIGQIIAPNSIDAVITSPPYPNEKDYTRTTRLESVVLGFFTDMMQLRGHKKRLLRSNTRGVYKADTDDLWVKDNQKIQKIADAIESRRVELGKTSGFERLYPRVTRLYFGGMARHFAELTTVLRPGARLAYVVGDQASYLRVLIRTGELLGEIAEQIGYQVERIDLFRTRFATATQTDLREEVLVLRWPGPH
jgi:DNA modification methylase